MARRIGKKPLIEQIEKNKGNISAVARAFGIARNTAYALIERNDLMDYVEDQRETLLDDVETALYKKATKQNDTAAMIFILKTRGKNRGYIERQEVTGADGGSIDVKVTKLESALNKIYGDE